MQAKEAEQKAEEEDEQAEGKKIFKKESRLEEKKSKGQISASKLKSWIFWDTIKFSKFYQETIKITIVKKTYAKSLIFKAAQVWGKREKTWFYHW